MKTKFTILFLLLINFCFAQEVPKDIAKRVNEARYIFEGRVIRSDCYWSSNQTKIYTSSTIEITKIVKGDLVCGTVEIITVGGRIGGKEIEISHNLVLAKGMMGVFLCDKNIWETPVIDYYPETNGDPLWVPEGLEGFIRYYKDGINYAVNDWQFSLDSLAQLYDLMDLYTTLNLVDCGVAPLPASNPHHTNHPYVLPSYTNNQLQPVGPHPTSIATQSNIHFDFLNRHIMVAGSQKYFEFDIAISDDVDTGYFYASTFTVKYPSQIFGYNIVDNNKVEVTTTGSLSGTTAYLINPYDERPSNSDTLIIQIIPDSTSSDPFVNLPDIGPTLHPALHVRIEITDCFPAAGISMRWVNPYVYPTYSATQYYSSSIPISYILPWWSTVLHFPSCGIHVDAITATTMPITGGTQDTVTITGLDFDSARMSGNVWVRTANDNGSYIHLDSVDYVYWSDSAIAFVMPGDGSYFDTTGSFGCPGSGFIRVENDAGDTAQTDSVTVWYSIGSAYYNSYDKKFMYELANVYSSQHGYEFMIDTAFEKSLHPDRWKVIDVAIKEWVCLSGVNFILGDTLTPTGYEAATDRICRIQFGRTTSQSTVAQATKIRSFFTNCGGSAQRLFTEEIDIIVDSTRKDSLFWDTNCYHDVPPGKYDIYASILHELGHGHSINHVNDRRDIMYWLDRGRYGVPHNDRNIYIKFDPSASDAANFVTTKATDPTISISCAASLLGVRTIPDCDSLPRGRTGCNPIWVEEIQKTISKIVVFPNPVESNFELGFESDRFMTGRLEIKDIFGRILYSSEKKNISAGWNYYPIDVHNFLGGVYCVGINSTEESAFTKFIKQ